MHLSQAESQLGNYRVPTSKDSWKGFGMHYLI